MHARTHTDPYLCTFHGFVTWYGQKKTKKKTEKKQENKQEHLQDKEEDRLLNPTLTVGDYEDDDDPWIQYLVRMTTGCCVICLY